MRRAAAVAALTAGLLAIGAPAYAETVVSYGEEVPAGTCAEAPAGPTPGVDTSVGDTTVRVPVVDDATVCATATVTVYADLVLLPRPFAACAYGPAAYGEGAGAAVTDGGAGAAYTADGTPTETGTGPAPELGYETGYIELLGSNGYARCP